MLVLEAAVFTICCLLLNWAEGRTSVLFALGAIWAPSLVTMIGILVYFLSGVRREWITSFFKHNIPGYLARFWVPLAQRDPTWHCQIVTDLHDPTPEDEKLMIGGGFAIEVPLAGWFAGFWFFRGTRLLLDSSPIFVGARYWRVQLHQIYPESGVVYVRVQWMSPIRDGGKKECLVLEVGDALRVIEHIYKSTSSETTPSLSEALVALMRQKAERDALSATTLDNLTAMRTERDDLVATLELIADAIVKTDRFKTQIEGLTLYVQVLTKLADVHHDNPAAFARIDSELRVARVNLDLARLPSRVRRGRSHSHTSG